MSENRRRVCLLTGAGGRLGSMFSRLYGHEYDILAVYHTRTPEPPPEVCWHVDPLNPTLRKPAGTARFEAIRSDLTLSGEIPRVVEAALDRFGGVDLLVNAAAHIRLGSLLSGDAGFVDVRCMFEMNAIVPLRLAIELSRQCWSVHDAEENSALNRNVVNVSSTSGAYVFGGYGQGGYSASKAALNMLTCHMAEEFSSLGIRVNNVSPGAFPEALTTESVCDAIVRLDRDSMTGKMLMLEAEGETVI